MAINSDREVVACKALAEAVLVDALKELNHKPMDKVERKQLAETVAWFNDDSEGYLFAFIPLCTWLGLEASAVRRLLKAKSKV